MTAYKVVPVEATDEMVSEGWDSKSPAEAYRDMIQAAPDSGMVAVRRGDLLTLLNLAEGYHAHMIPPGETDATKLMNRLRAALEPDNG